MSQCARKVRQQEELVWGDCDRDAVGARPARARADAVPWAWLSCGVGGQETEQLLLVEATGIHR